MKLLKNKKIILGIGGGLVILTTSIVTPVVLLNKNENVEKSTKNDVEKLLKILKAKTAKEKVIELPSDSSGKIIADNQEKIIAKIKTLVGESNVGGVKIVVAMENDVSISIAAQKIIIKLTKNGVSKVITDFAVRKQGGSENKIASIIDEDIAAIKAILDTKTGNDLLITLPSGATGNIIGKVANKNTILRRLRMLIDPSNANGNANHPSLRGTSIEVAMSTDAPISTSPQSIRVSITKSGKRSFETSSIFQVKRNFTADDDIATIKAILDTKTGRSLNIVLQSSATGNIIGKVANKNAILRRLRMLIDPSNVDGNANHPSLRGTSIEVRIKTDRPISKIYWGIIVSISKSGGTTVETSKTFVVRRGYTINESISQIKQNLDSFEGNRLIITLPSGATGNIIGNANNKNAILRKLRMLVNGSNTNGDTDHWSLFETSIDVAIGTDAPISERPQAIRVSISRSGGTTVETSKTFQVKRGSIADDDILAIKAILSANYFKDKDIFYITLPSSSSGSIIKNPVIKDAVERKVRMIIDPSNANGDHAHASLRGTTITLASVPLVGDSITDWYKPVFVTISKTGGTSVIINYFSVRKAS